MEEDEQLIAGLDQFNQKAFEMIKSPRAREAFDISRETVSLRSSLTRMRFSQSCLLAIRLVEAGVRFVSLSLGVGIRTRRILQG